MKVEPIGELRDGLPFTITPVNDSIGPNQNYTFLLEVPKDLGKVRKVHISLTQQEIPTPEEQAKQLAIEDAETNIDKSIFVIVEKVIVRFLSNLNEK